MLSFLFSRRSEARSNRKRHTGRKPSRRDHALRLGFEPLESRQLLSVTPTVTPATTLVFDISADAAQQGVYVGLYTNNSPGVLNQNGLYLSSAAGETETIAHAAAKHTALPLIKMAEGGTVYHTQLIIPADTDFESAELFIFVGGDPSGALTISGTGSSATVAAPNAAADPASSAVAYNFAQIEFNYQQQDDANGAAGLDLDTSAINSTGFPITIAYPDSANLPFAQSTLGITVSQTDLRDNFQAAFSAGGEYSDLPEFKQCATYAQIKNPADLQVIAPQSILSAEVTPPTLVSANPTSSANGHLSADCDYYYLITAFSSNVIDNSGGRLGETLISNGKTVTKTMMVGNNSVELTWDPYCDPNTVGYNIYRYSTTNAGPDGSTPYSLIASVYGATPTVPGATTMTYTDCGAIPQAQQISSDTSTGYGFNPLSEYYTAEIKKFFDYYEYNKTGNMFVLHEDDVLWYGSTVEYVPAASWNATNASYRVLQLTAQNANPAKTVDKGEVINVYEPIFSSNTSYVDEDAPPMPSWLTNQNESPAQMVFGCDGVFASGKYDLDLAAIRMPYGPLNDVENCIVSALNRGIAANGDILPDNWAAFPQITALPSVATDATSALTAGTYYYYVTAENAYGETTPSLEVSAAVTAGQSITLSWINGPNAETPFSYYIYRGTSPDSLTLYDSVEGAAVSYTDTGAGTQSSTTAPNQYFAEGSTSNWYAAFVQTNSSVDPVNGVSINGMSYGFPFSDQGGLSTNVQFPIGQIPQTISINLGQYSSGPSFITQSLPDAIAGTSYQQTITVSGSGVGTVFSVTDGVLPTGLTLNPDTGILSGTPTTATADPQTFTVTATNSAGSVSKQFSLTIDSASTLAPLVVVGSAVTTTTTPPTITYALYPAVDSDSGWTSYVRVTGGSGSYTMTGVSVPSNVKITGLDAGLTSENGLFKLTGTLTVGADSVTGFQVSIADSQHPGTSITVTMNVLISPALAFNTTTLNTPSQGKPFFQQLQTTGSGVTFSVAEGSTLPTGISLTSSGCLYGTWPEQDNYSFTIEATDTSTPSATNPVTHTYTGSTQSSPTDLQITTTSLPTTTMSDTYSGAIVAEGGGGTYTFTVVNGLMPYGIGMSKSGVLGGQATNTGDYQFTVRVTDDLGNTAYQSFQISVVNVESNTHNLAQNASTLVITGSGFDTTTLDNVVSLSGGAVVTGGRTDSSTQLTVLVDVSTLSVGDTLTAYVSVDGLSVVSAVVATIVAPVYPVITFNPQFVAPDVQSLTFEVSDFDDSGSGTNLVTLSSGTISQVWTTATGLEVIFKPGSALSLNALTGWVTIDGVVSSTQQVAVVAASTPSVDSSTDALVADAKTLVITGAGFDPAGSNSVTLYTGESQTALPSDQVASVVVNSATQLTVTLNSVLTLPTGSLYATVITDGASSGSPVKVASVVDGGPTINFSAGNLSTAGTTLVISGANFTEVTSVTLSTIARTIPGLSFATDGNSMTVTLPAGVLTTDLDQLYATITTPTATSNTVQVATIIDAPPPPTLAPSQDRWASTAPQLIITGTNFDTAANGVNYVTLSTGEVLPAVALSSTELVVPLTGSLPLGPLNVTVTTDGVTTDDAEVANIVNVLAPTVTSPTTPYNIPVDSTSLTINGTNFDTNSGASIAVTLSSGTVLSVKVASSSQLLVTLDPATSLLLPGSVTATVMVDGLSSGAPVQVATVAAGPSITPVTANWSAGSATLTINGQNFGPTVADNDVHLYNGNGDYLGAANILDASSQQLVIQGPNVPLGTLWAKVTVDSASTSYMTPIATVIPGVTANTTSVFNSATGMTIYGADFDATPSNNQVILYSGTTKLGTATVTSASSTALAIKFTKTPNLGPLYAVAYVKGTPSLKTQVATVTGPVSATTSTFTASATSIIAPDSITLTVQAKDAYGYNITANGLKVIPALAAGSAGGTFSAFTRQSNGTYTATFTGTTMGADTITVSVNGVTLTAKVVATVRFQSDFSGTGTIGARWARPFGTFTVASNVATAGAKANNIAIYNSKCPANVSTSVTVSNIANGSFAALVARYTQSVGFYRAGIQASSGKLYAVIQKVAISRTGVLTVTTLVSKAVSSLGAGLLNFNTVGTSLKLSLNGTVVATATDSTYKSGGVGISGTPNTKFASFTGVVSSSTSAKKTTTNTGTTKVSSPVYTKTAIRSTVYGMLTKASPIRWW
jgi:hypothetical protein